jgi:hypothetical protein
MALLDCGQHRDDPCPCVRLLRFTAFISLCKALREVGPSTSFPGSVQQGSHLAGWHLQDSLASDPRPFRRIARCSSVAIEQLRARHGTRSTGSGRPIILGGDVGPRAFVETLSGVDRSGRLPGGQSLETPGGRCVVAKWLCEKLSAGSARSALVMEIARRGLPGPHLDAKDVPEREASRGQRGVGG